MTVNELLLAAKLAMPRHNVSALCRELNISRATYYSWCNWDKDGTLPEDDKLGKLAELAGVSVDAATFAVYAARVKNPIISKVFAQQAALF
ncbi:hypothetical protein AAOGI_06910 [Agarivorans albus]